MANNSDLTVQALKQKQSLPLEAKVHMTLERIRQWYEYWDGQIYIAFSGGKDSRVLADLVWSIYPDVPGVFCDTGLEWPEIRVFVKTFGDRIVWIKPKYTFRVILDRWGFPVVSKEVSQKIYEVRTTKSAKLMHKRMHGADNKYKSGKIPEKWKYLIKSPFKIGYQCCDVMKKNPSKLYEKSTGRKPMVGTMVEDSHARRQKYIRKGHCNSFDGKIESMPLSFWVESDIWAYIRSRDVSYCEIYDMGYDRTGCMFCMFGVHLEKGCNRFQRMKETHPKQWKFCMDTIGLRDVLKCLHVPCEGGDRELF